MMWEIRVTHSGLHTYRVVRGASKEEAELKARLQLEAWDARWNRTQEIESARQARLGRRYEWERQVDADKRAKDHALELTKDAEANIVAVKSLLSISLATHHSLDWESLKDITEFAQSQPPPA